MWWIKEGQHQDRGGFQDRDIGRSNFDQDYGPDYGPDYARYADPPDLAADARLRENLINVLTQQYSSRINHQELKVRNGFVILRGEIASEALKEEVTLQLKEVSGVRDVINLLQEIKH
jgi:hypothetical protein